jgi:glycosyltransferase involved in cell wall biosynthesis
MTRPLFSILTPVYNTDLRVLAEAAQSVFDQESDDWEWIVVDDASPRGDVRDFLLSVAAHEPRLKVVLQPENRGIAMTSQHCLELATGEFVALLDHDDVLTADALSTMARHIDRHPTADYLYSDEDHLYEDGTLADTFAKPDWSPARMRSQMFTGHLSVLRRRAVLDVGGFDASVEGSQDYDLVLKVTELGGPVVHVPKVLYHWRAVATSVSGDPNAKPYAWEAGRLAVERHCRRRGFAADVTTRSVLGTYEARRGGWRDGQVVVYLVVPRAVDAAEQWLKVLRASESTPYVHLLQVPDSSVRACAVLLHGLHSAALRPLAGVQDAVQATRQPGSAGAIGRVMFVDGNLVPQADDFVDALVGALVADDEVIVSPMVFAVDGSRVVFSGLRLDPEDVACGYLQHRSDPRGGNALNVARDSPAYYGGCWAIRASELEAVSTASSAVSVQSDGVPAPEHGRTLWTPNAELVVHDAIVNRYFFEAAVREHQRVTATRSTV